MLAKRTDKVVERPKSLIQRNLDQRRSGQRQRILRSLYAPLGHVAVRREAGGVLEEPREVERLIAASAARRSSESGAPILLSI